MAPEEVRRHNLSTVLERLHLVGPVARSELTATTGLNRSTIAALVGELSAIGLVEERPGLVASGPGRPSPQVRARPEGAVVLAIELSVDSIAAATIGLGSHVYNRIRVARPRRHYSPERTVEDVAKLSDPLLGSLPTGHEFIGVGVAVAGLTRRVDGLVHHAPNLGWREIELPSMLAKALGVRAPVHVANEADLGALGELRRGGHQGVDHLIYVHGEVGIGAGVIADGTPLTGAAGYAGEAGHMLVNPDGEKCRCGAVGCWETEAGEAAILRRMGQRASATGLRVVDAIVERAVAGEEHTLTAIGEAGRWLGWGIGNLINLFNPQLVVLGGLYARLFPYLEARMLDGFRARALKAPGAMARIVPSTLGSDALLIGAAELLMTDVIGDPAGSHRIGHALSADGTVSAT